MEADVYSKLDEDGGKKMIYKMADRANCPNVEEDRRCARPREILRHDTSKSHHEAAREDPGWEDPKESRARIG